MSNDPLDSVFVTGDEAAALKRADTARKLATYLERMPIELRGMFTDEFQHINRAELDQLRADLAAAQERIAQQAAQLEQAIELLYSVTYCACQEHRESINAWLSAHAPQPQEQSA